MVSLPVNALWLLQCGSVHHNNCYESIDRTSSFLSRDSRLGLLKNFMTGFKQTQIAQLLYCKAGKRTYNATDYEQHNKLAISLAANSAFKMSC